MDTERLKEIVSDATITLRDGAAEKMISKLVVLDVIERTSAAMIANRLNKEDDDTTVIAVYRDRADAYREEFLELLAEYPDKGALQNASVEAVAKVVGSLETAVALFALGQSLKLWHVESLPHPLGFMSSARQAAGLTLLMIGGFDPSILPTLL